MLVTCNYLQYASCRPSHDYKRQNNYLCCVRANGYCIRNEMNSYQFLPDTSVASVNVDFRTVNASPVNESQLVWDVYQYQASL
jgi:hypothetical protein